jgi:hypothetical protein
MNYRDSKMIEKYVGFFHDGSIHDIRHEENSIVIVMESAELLPEWNANNIILSKRNTISGKLYLRGVKSIKINEKEFYGEYKMVEEEGEILDFEIAKNRVTLGISWYKFIPKLVMTGFDFIEIEASNVQWDNQPEVADKYWACS